MAQHIDSQPCFHRSRAHFQITVIVHVTAQAHHVVCIESTEPSNVHLVFSPLIQLINMLKPSVPD